MGRKFYKAKIVVEVVAEEPIDFSSLQNLSDQITTGDWVGQYKIKEHLEISPKDAVEQLEKLGSEPGFFQLNPDGSDQ